MQNNNYKRKNAVESIEYRPKSGKYDTYLRGKRDEGVEIVSKKYAYIYHLDDEGYWTGLESVEAAPPGGAGGGGGWRAGGVFDRRANLMLTWCLSPRQRSMCRVSGMIG